MASFYNGNDTDLLFSGETQSDHDETELLSAQEAVKKLEEVCVCFVCLYFELTSNVDLKFDSCYFGFPMAT